MKIGEIAAVEALQSRNYENTCSTSLQAFKSSVKFISTIMLPI